MQGVDNVLRTAENLKYAQGLRIMLNSLFQMILAHICRNTATVPDFVCYLD